MKRFHLRLAADSHLIGVLFVLAAMVIWSTVPVGTRFLMQGGAFSVAFISASRLWLAAAVFLVIRAISCRHTCEPFRIPLHRIGWLIISAVALCFNYLFYAIGLHYTTAGATSVVSQVHSVAIVLLAALLLGERLTGQKIAGMLLSVAGVLLVVFQGSSFHDLTSSTHLLGNLIEIMAALSWPFYVIGQTKLLQDGGTRQVLMPIFVSASILVCFLLPFTGPLIVHAPTLRDWGVLVFLGMGSTALAYWLFAAGMQRIETSEGAMFNVMMPITALFMAHWLLGEALHSSMLGGLALVVMGLVLIIWRRHHSPLRRQQARKMPSRQYPSLPASRPAMNHR